MNDPPQNAPLISIGDGAVNMPRRIHVRKQARRPQWISPSQCAGGIQPERLITKAIELRQIQNGKRANGHIKFQVSKLAGSMFNIVTFKPANLQLPSIHQRQKIFVEARIVCQFRVKRCSEEMALLGGNNSPVGD